MLNQNKNITVLGIDPGLAITGLAVLKKNNGQVLPLVFDCIKTYPKDSLQKRLAFIYSRLSEIIDKYSPQAISIEELFFPIRFSTAGQPLYPKTIMGTGQVRGLVFLIAGQRDLDIIEYPPKSVKISITGYGNAGKIQVQDMVKRLLGLKQIDGPDDISDALAIALCHLYTLRT